MENIVIRPFCLADEPAVLTLNKTSEHLLSPMDGGRFHTLRKSASVVWVGEQNGKIVAFLIAFTDGTEYDSINYRWFSRRLKDFLYIDRVVVSETDRSSGIGWKLYSDIEQWACSRSLIWLAAEVDIEPPNTKSLNFHDKQGFIEVARQRVENCGKIVSLQVKSIGKPYSTSGL